MEHHDPLEFTPGDDWVIEGALVDVDGAKLDLTGAIVEWVLIYPDGATALMQDSPFVALTIADLTSGEISIRVGRGATILLDPGRYTDAVRVSMPGGDTSSMWTGQLLVGENAFYQEDAPP